MSNFNQKKRNHPIIITDIAISKVPKIQFPGFTNEENSFLQHQHKLLLKLAQTSNHSGEVGILIDIITWQTWVILGSQNSISMKSNVDAASALINHKKNTLLFMHNHPNTGTFSGEDFKTFCIHHSLYMMTVVGNDGSVRALIKEPPFDPVTAMEAYGKLALIKYATYKNNGTSAIKELLKNSKSLGLTYKEGGKKHDLSGRA